MKEKILIVDDIGIGKEVFINSLQQDNVPVLVITNTSYIAPMKENKIPIVTVIDSFPQSGKELRRERRKKERKKT